MNWGSKTKKAGGLSLVVILALPLTAQYEGLRTKAYLDPIGIPTICWGETEGVELGQIKSREECDNMLAARLGYFSLQVKNLVTYPMTPSQHAAYSSFVYNIGVNAFKKSSVLRLANEGKKAESCEFMKRYIYAGGKKLNGLVKRRQSERDLCLK